MKRITLIIITILSLLSISAFTTQPHSYTVKETVGRYYPESHQILFKANTSASNGTTIQIIFTDKYSNNMITKTVPVYNGKIIFTLTHVKPGDYFISTNVNNKPIQLGEMYIPN